MGKIRRKLLSSEKGSVPGCTVRVSQQPAILAIYLISRSLSAWNSFKMAVCLCVKGCIFP